MKPEDIVTIQDAERFVEGCLNDFSECLSTKEETMTLMGQYTQRLMNLFLENAKKKLRENPELMDNKEAKAIDINW